MDSQPTRRTFRRPTWSQPKSGLAFGLNSGSGYVLRQLVERRRLRREGVLARDPVAFYDWAVDRGVLRRVGGGWQFRHLLLRNLAAEQFGQSLIAEVDQATASVAGEAPATDP